MQKAHEQLALPAQVTWHAVAVLPLLHVTEGHWQDVEGGGGAGAGGVELTSPATAARTPA